MAKRNRSTDLSLCDREPIHIPGSIQPHGALLALRPDDLRILQVSDNLPVYLGLLPEQALDAPLQRLVGPDVAEQLTPGTERPLGPIEMAGATHSLLGHVHLHDGLMLLEVEPAPTRSWAWHTALVPTLRRMEAARSVQQLCQILVEEVRRLTGFDRVVAYRFDEDGHGMVIAEDRIAAIESYLGQHFPASDVPQQARELYRQNWVRLIPDARYEPAVMVPRERPDTHTPLDMGPCLLRGVSPIHREYMVNMGVRASLSLSLVRQGKLWGLVTCGHRRPRFVDFAMRTACEMIARLTSLRISALEESARCRYRDERAHLLKALTAAMQEAGEDVLTPLLTRPQELLDLVDADGAVVWSQSLRGAVGTTPPQAAVEEVVRWLAGRKASVIHETVTLGHQLPALAPYAAKASGLLAFTLPKQGSHHVLWFRKEETATVPWAGDPNKSVARDGEILRPRHSFAVWQQVVHGKSLAWRSGAKDLARDLRRHALEIDLARQFETSRRTASAREELLAVVSHDLRSPLGVVKLQAEWLRDRIERESLPASVLPRFQAALDRIERSTRHMHVLIEDLLDLARIDAGQFFVQLLPNSLRQLVADAVDLLSPLARTKSIALAYEVPENLVVEADHDRMLRVLTNLVGNAIKFTPAGGSIHIGAHAELDWAVIQVVDSGVGVHPEELERLFDRYWRGERSGGKGTGLGLYIAKGIVEAHGGEMTASSAVGVGTTITFTLRRQRPSPPPGE